MIELHVLLPCLNVGDSGVGNEDLKDLFLSLPSLPPSLPPCSNFPITYLAALL